MITTYLLIAAGVALVAVAVERLFFRSVDPRAAAQNAHDLCAGTMIRIDRHQRTVDRLTAAADKLQLTLQRTDLPADVRAFLAAKLSSISNELCCERFLLRMAEFNLPNIRATYDRRCQAVHDMNNRLRTFEATRYAGLIANA